MRTAANLPPGLFILICICLTVSAAGRTITVTTSEDEFDPSSGGRISLREAVRDLEGAGGTICFSSSVLEIVLDRELPLVGSGGVIVIDAEGFGGRPLKILPGSRFDGERLLVVENQRAQIKNAVFDRPASADRSVLLWAVDAGGGADLRVENCVFENWVASERSAAAVRCRAGSSLTITGCEFGGNVAGVRGVSAPERLTVENSLFYYHRDAAIVCSVDTGSAVTVRNSTFAENVGTDGVVSLSGAGGADKLTVNHCTFVDNVAAAFRGPAVTTMDYCLFARNVPRGAASKVSIIEGAGSGVTSGGYNLADDSPAGLDDPSDLTGTAVKVSRLGDFGGERYCCFPLAGSRAIDGGDPNRSTVLPATDTRGFARKAKSFGMGTFSNIVDIGAVETNPEGTLVVDQTGNFGAGSLRDAVAKSNTGETAHIVIQPPIGSRVFAVTTPIVFAGGRTYQIDATRGIYHFEGQRDDGPLFQVEGGDTTLSFAGLQIENYALDEFSKRGFIRVTDGKLALHDSHFAGNQTEEVGIVEADRARVFLNECSFLDNVMSANDTVGVFGGIALDVDTTSTTVWNSSFIRNRTEMRNGGVSFEGGAVRLLNPQPSRFRQCTFARNKADGPGAAVYFGDYSAVANLGLTLDRCTVVGNENKTVVNYSKGAIGFENRSSVAVGACLFADNGNDRNELADADLFSRGGVASVTVSRPCPNWTDRAEAFPGLVESGNLSADLRFAPPSTWGGGLTTMPLLHGSGFVAECDDPDQIYARDAVNDPGFAASGSGFTPGAVQQTVDFDEALSITELPMTDDTARVRLRGRFGVRWIVEDSVDLKTFFPTGQTYTGSILPTTLQIPIRQPRPAAWYYRIREDTD